jgi:hypothetical protein
MIGLSKNPTICRRGSPPPASARQASLELREDLLSSAATISAFDPPDFAEARRIVIAAVARLF